MKHVPRWALGGDALDKIIKKQRTDKSHIQVFGTLSSNYATKAFDLKQIFSKGEDAQSYIHEERGSSADWNDASEFGSPRVGHAQLNADRKSILSLGRARLSRPSFTLNKSVIMMDNSFGHISEEPNSEQ